MASRFPPAFLDELRSRADIVQVVSRYVQLSSKGGRYWGLCPFHGEKTPSFSVRPDRQMYYCFGCHASGSAIDFVMQMEHLEFREAVVQLAEGLHMQVPELVETREGGLTKDERERLYDANRQAAKFYHQQLWRAENAHVLAYLHGRGIDDHTIRVFGLGSTPAASDGATRALQELGFGVEELVRAGITRQREGRSYDMFRSRAIFPIIDARGHVLGFGGRALGDEKPKYLNTGDTPVFNKRMGVFAANLLAKQRGLRRIVLTEGYMDVIALVQAGFSGVCATLGTALTPEQAHFLKRFAPEVWVSYDGDAAGQTATLRALDIFDAEQMRARVLVYPDGMDPDEYIRKNGPASLDTLAPLDAITYRMMREAEKHDLSTQEGRTEYAKGCATWLAKVREPVELENYVQRLMVETGFARDVLLAQIGRAEFTAPKERQTPLRVVRPQRSKTDRDLAILSAESTLLRVLIERPSMRDTLSPEDFITPQSKQLAQALIAGENPAAILEQMPDDEERSLFAELVMRDAPREEENDLKVVGDCLNRLRKRRVEMEIDSLRAQLSTLSPEGKREALERIAKLQASRQALETRKDGG